MKIKSGNHSSIPEGVTIPAELELEFVTLAEKGFEAESAGRARLAEAYKKFLTADESKKTEAGKELVQAIFGKNAVAEKSLR